MGIPYLLSLFAKTAPAVDQNWTTIEKETITPAADSGQLAQGGTRGPCKENTRSSVDKMMSQLSSIPAVLG